MADNFYDEDMPECPLCMEALGLDDINFFPCACRYQICRFCWHRIRTDENGLCPHCREPYSENPAEYTPLTQDQLSKLKSEKRQKTTERKQKLMESRKNLADVRVIQKNLVFVVGLSPRLADPETLKKNEYFGKYGRIFKVVINNHTVYNGTQGPSVSAYVTFYREEDALKAISAVNNAYIDGRYLKASFGTTKYCTTFLRGSQCTKPDCMYLHALGDNEASFTKEDMHLGKHQVFEQSALAAANIEPKDIPIEVSVPSPVVNSVGSAAAVSVKVKPVQVSVPKVPVLTDGGEGSALPSTASWASSTQKDNPSSVQPLPHSKDSRSYSSTHSKSSKHTQQRTSCNHSPKSRSMTSSPKSISHSSHSRPSSKSKREQKDITTRAESPSNIPMLDPVLEYCGVPGSREVQRTSSTGSVNSGRSSSSKSWNPDTSPKSTLSKSLSSNDSLDQDSTTDSPNFMFKGLAPSDETGFGRSISDEGTEDPTSLFQSVGSVDSMMHMGTRPAHPTNPVVDEEDAIFGISPNPTSKIVQTESVKPIPRIAGVSPSVSAGTNVFAINLPESEYKVLGHEYSHEGLVAVSREVKYDCGSTVAPPLASHAFVPYENDGSVLDVLSGFGSAASGQFGSLGISWNSQVPSVLTNNSDSSVFKPSSIPSPIQHEDDLEFDPWDVSQQGLADLMETEAEQQRKPFHSHVTEPAIYPGLMNGISESDQGLFPSSSMSGRGLGVSNKGTSDPWKDELRTLFPDVNISFGGSSFPCTATKAKTDRSASSLHQALDATHINSTTAAYHTSQLANAVNYSYHPVQSIASVGQQRTSASLQSVGTSSSLKSTYLGSNNFPTQVTGSSFPASSFPATSTKVINGRFGLPLSGGSRVGLGNSEWPSFGEGTSVTRNTKETEVKESNTAHTVLPATTATSSLPSPPPGFGAKSSNPGSSRSVSKGATSTTVSACSGTTSTTGVAGGSLSSSVNHALWANTQLQGKGHVLPNHLLQSWSNFLNYSALTPAQQQQLARNSQNYQYLLAQQYLLMQTFLMRGYPMLQAQAQAQAQIQASLRAQLQQHALRQQQVAGAVSVVGGVATSNPSMAGSKTVAQNPKSNSSVVSTISSSKPQQDGATSSFAVPHKSSSTNGSTTTHSSTNTSVKNPVQYNGKSPGHSGLSNSETSKNTNSSVNSSTLLKGSHQNHIHHHHVKNKPAQSYSGVKQTKNSTATSGGSSSEKRVKQKGSVK